ncbi:MAG TPA: sulfotransferase [Stellaceae bacterium]|nr:sulfotransferase [Stellaceae bacterium]
MLRDFQAAFAHDQAGRRDRAEALYRKVLQKAPDHADALHLLGLIAHQRGRHQRAVKLIERALAIAPDFPAAHANLGSALKAMGRRTAASAAYHRAIALNPNYAVAHCNLAAVQLEQGALAAGLASAERAVALMPGLVEAHLNRADALARQRQFEAAERSLRRALELMPQRAATHSRLGAVLAELGRFDEATASHEQAIDLRPGDPLLHFDLGRTQFQAQELAASEASFRRALSLDRDLAPAWYWLGSLQLVAGSVDDALSCLRRAVAVDPDHAEAHEALAYSGQLAGEAQLERLGALAGDAERPVAQRVAAGFAAAGFLDNAGRHDDAFPHLAAANGLQRQLLADAGEQFDPDGFAHEVDGLIERCTPSLFSAVAERGNPSELPVFVVGMPRSGTSLVEQIAASHSQVLGGGERKEISRLAAAVLAHNRDRSVDEWDVDVAWQLADRHIADLQRLAGGVSRVTDKMPDNILHLGTVAVLFPAARVIFCRRDPRDNCLSCFFQRFGEGNAFAYDLADCARRCLETERLAEHWRRVLPLAMLTVDYEALIADPEGESRRLFEFLGLDWEPGCLQFHRTRRPVFSASLWQVRQPVFSRSLGRWRNYERHLQPLLGVFAADANGGKHTTPQT